MWIEVKEPHAEPPRGPEEVDLPESDELGRNEFVDESWIGELPADVDSAHDMLLVGCNLASLSFAECSGSSLTAIGCTFNNCDLSGLRVRQMANCHVSSSKLMGTDFSGTETLDVTLSSCSLSFTNFRMAILHRMAFRDCQLTEVDFFESELRDISFVDSRITETNFQRVKASWVDLRGAESLGLNPIDSLRGMLIDEMQLPMLQYVLAGIAGASIEQR